MNSVFDNSLLPTSYSDVARGGAEFLTAIVRSGPGGIIAHRNINREDYVSRYEIDYKDLASERKEALKRFVILRQGQARAFRFLAPDASAIENEAVGYFNTDTGDIVPVSALDGELAEFYIIETYSDGTNFYVRRIVKPSPLSDWTLLINNEGGELSAAGVFPGGYYDETKELFPSAKIINLPDIGNVLLDYDLGKLLFETAPAAGSEIRLTGGYHIIAALSEDAQQFLIDEGGTGEVTLAIEEVLPVEIGISESNRTEAVFLGVDLTAPADNAVVAGDVTITADAPGASSVVFYVDGREAGLKTSAPFTLTLDSNLFGEGVHYIFAAGRGANGELAYSRIISVNVQNVGVPVLNGIVVTKSSVKLEWTQASGADGYKISVDGVVTDAGNVLTATISNLTKGTHKFRVKSYNDAGFESAFSNEVVLVPNPVRILYDTATGKVLFDTATGDILGQTDN